MANFGIGFMPGQAPDPTDPANGGGGRQASPYQSAIKILSLRLPKFVGAGGLAPAPLLNSPGAMGQAPISPPSMGAAPPQSALAQTYAQLAGMTPPTPHITPGIELPGIGGAPQQPVRREPDLPPMRPIPPEAVQGGPYLPLPENATPFGHQAILDYLARKNQDSGNMFER